ncbi:MAG TPA: hypothetical protein VND66_10115 [Acidobacteriaceae bacterium]|nr:hypothetical protein [Acidobacteriaceae bacterium]
MKPSGRNGFARRTPTGLMVRGCVVLLVIVLLIDPSDMMLHLKMPFFALVMLLWLYRQVWVSSQIRRERDRRLNRSVWIATLVVALVIPSIWTLIGIISANVHSGDTPFGLLKTFLFFLIVPVLISERIDLMAIIEKSSVLVAVITFLLVAASLISPQLLIGLLFFIMDHRNGIITPDRNVFGLGLGEFYYSTCPIMIFPFSRHCWTMMEGRAGCRIGAATLCVFFGSALLLTGARANILAALCLLFFFVLRRIRKSAGWATALMIGVLMVTAAAVTVVPRAVNPREGSNAIKLGHIHSYEEEFNERPSVLLWGEGANSAFYSEGFKAWTTVTEVTYLELVRIFGLPMAALLCAGLVWVASRLFIRGALATGLAFVAYLGIASSNPLLLNSMGFLVVGAAYVHAQRCAEAERQQNTEHGVWAKAPPLSVASDF